MGEIENWIEIDEAKAKAKAKAKEKEKVKMDNIKQYFKHTVVDGNRRVTVAEESEGAISVTTETSHTGETRKRTHTVTATSYFKNRRQLEQLSMAINGALGQ